jgi:hypothetical protein
MPQLKVYKRCTYQCLRQCLRHILKERELHQDIKNTLLSISPFNNCCQLREHVLPQLRSTKHFSLLLHLIIPKHSFTSAKVSQYFVREIKRTQTIEKKIKSSLGRSQTYHCCSHRHQPYQPKLHWTQQLHTTHWLQPFGQISLIDLSASLHHWLISLIGLNGSSALSASAASMA